MISKILKFGFYLFAIIFVFLFLVFIVTAQELSDSEKLVIVKSNLINVIDDFNDQKISLQSVKDVATEQARLRSRLGIDKCIYDKKILDFICNID